MFAGETLSGEPVAIKQLYLLLEAGAHRELAVVDELARRNYDHILPLLDGGEDANGAGYFIVMAKAGGSLKDEVERRRFDARETAEVLLQIACGLLEVGELVHRDLKPANILRHERSWKIADFGIARFVEESTSSKTVARFRSDYYAAPEQWREEPVTHATDVYALGCIGFSLLTGKPPFTADPRREHQHAPAPPVPCNDPALRGLISMMLRKPADARPDLGRIRNVLTGTLTAEARSQSAAVTNLAAVGAQIARRKTAELAEHERQMSIKRNRDALVNPATQQLKGMAERLWEKISIAAPEAKRT